MKSLVEQRTVEEIRGRMGCLQEMDARRWGLMTAGAVVRHLRGAFAMAVGDRPVKPAAVPLPRPVMKQLALRMPMQWPKNLPTIPELQRETELSPELRTEFAEDKQGLLAAYERFLGRKGNWPEHPMFGAMSERDWMRWGYLHTDHHLRQFGR